VGNILTVFAFGLVGLVLLRLLRPVPWRWPIFAVVLTALLYLTFVRPGGPILFLSTLPAMGFNPVPFGVIATLGVLATVLWCGDVVLRRVEDIYRAGILVVVGVYFFAFLEAIVFIQQRLEYI
jgi:hypothetical protein